MQLLLTTDSHAYASLNTAIIVTINGGADGIATKSDEWQRNLSMPSLFCNLNESYCVCVVSGHGQADKGFLRD